MNLPERIAVLSQLGDKLKEPNDYLEAVMHRTKYNNAWFTIENQQKAIDAIAENFLDGAHLEEWVNSYKLEEEVEPKTIGLVMAGNIPLVGFHDVLSVFISGHKSLIKLSDKDRFLLPYLIKLLGEFNASTAPYFQFTERLKDFDAVIATGSNNSARYFQTYFGKVPNIIRKNRNAIAILRGDETTEDLSLLANDIVQYFGLGCRNVSKIYVPEGYDFQLLLERLHEHRQIVMHHKYKNNFDYNLALLMMNRDIYWNNGCIIMMENKAIASKIAMLHFEYYKNTTDLSTELAIHKDSIQCIAAKEDVAGLETVAFGQAQHPRLNDYADGVDTLQFLSTL